MAAVPMSRMISRQFVMIAVGALCLTACSRPERGAADRFTASGELIALSGGDAGAPGACMTCHGLDGRGNGAGTPRLAGLDRGYMAAQLDAYASGRRQHPEMSGIAARLTRTQQDMVSAYYAAMPFVPGPSVEALRSHPAAVLYHHGDPARGLAACASCHGSAGEGVGPGNPPLGAQPAAYLTEQMEQWRAARRRNDPQNVMLHISRALSRRETAALGAYAGALPGGLQRREFPGASPAARHGDPRSDASALRRRAAE